MINFFSLGIHFLLEMFSQFFTLNFYVPPLHFFTFFTYDRNSFFLDIFFFHFSMIFSWKCFFQLIQSWFKTFFLDFFSYSVSHMITFFLLRNKHYLDSFYFFPHMIQIFMQCFFTFLSQIINTPQIHSLKKFFSLAFNNETFFFLPFLILIQICSHKIKNLKKKKLQRNLIFSLN